MKGTPWMTGYPMDGTPTHEPQDLEGPRTCHGGHLGGQRVPDSGRARGDAPDIAHLRLSIECKHRKSLPAWLLDAMAQAVACAGPEQIPVAILHEHGSRHDGDLCVVRLADLRALIYSDETLSIPTCMRSSS